jgi:lipopolysaccharide transport system ATP-binding protein
MRPIVTVENLGKQYRLGTQAAAYSTIRESLTNGILRRNNGRANEQTIWALRDVNFEIAPGDVLGIIGRNGAGKSTLLKILSRVTEPTTGRVELHGRVGSLLEVGTGFHPELTGRENIFLNGSILGMSRKDILQKFDEIVSFAEVEKFMDTPVKRYSSGMYLRLAFAVAAHLEPEILVVDEVLAVGDFAFQQKCLNKMQDVSGHGRTILFVSHNIGAISRLCRRCILLEQGRIVEAGPTARVVQTYVSSGLSERAEYVQAPVPGQQMNLFRVALVGDDDQLRTEVGYHETFRFLFEYEINRPCTDAILGMAIFTVDGTCAFVSADFDAHPELLGVRPVGRYAAEVEIPGKWLNTGRYVVRVSLSCDAGRQCFADLEALAFNVIDTGTPGSRHGIERKGILQPVLDWSTKQLV